MILAALISIVLTADDGAGPVPRFEPQRVADVEIGYGVAIGDVNGDGTPDILLADRREFVWFRNPDWARFVMVERLTKRDHVCIAARDIDGDGRVEVAVGAMWNPGETTDADQSGSVHFLIRPDDPTQPWEPVRLPHEPTVHRMRWVRSSPDACRLVVLPLHGRGNVDGEGAGVRVLAYDPPPGGDPRGAWTTTLLDDTLHMTHNFDVGDFGHEHEHVVIAGRDGLVGMTATGGERRGFRPEGMDRGAGEVRFGRPAAGGLTFLATIEPMHGDTLVAYSITEENLEKGWPRVVIDDDLAQGHALACADLLGLGRDQVIAGWRNPNRAGRVGIRVYVPGDDAWHAHDLDVSDAGDMSGMACEDLRVADLDGDGRLDIVAAGRATRNLKIYWNRSR